jgi:hypothetical protein
MKTAAMTTVFLALRLAFAQGDPFVGVWKNAEVRLTLETGIASGIYVGDLEFAGKTYPVSSRSNPAGSSLSGSFAADGRKFQFLAHIDAGTMRFVTDGSEHVLTREGASNPLNRNRTDPQPSPSSAPPASAGPRHRHANGLSVNVPVGWTFQDGPQGIILLPPGVTFNPQQLDELYVAASQPGSASDPKVAEELRQGLGQQGGRLNQSTMQLGGRPVVVYSGQMRHTEQNAMIGVRIYLVQDGQNVNTVIGMGLADRVERNDPGLRLAAASIAFQAPPLPPAGAVSDGSGIANQWVQKLRGQKLQQLTTGNYDAGRSIWILAADGSFSYSSSYSGAVYAPGGGNASVGRTSNGQGRWRIVSRGAGAVLELRFSSGEQREYNLTANGSQTFMNGKRTYVTDPADGN